MQYQSIADCQNVDIISIKGIQAFGNGKIKDQENI
jgi:hypothetical protein